jgi:putative DNA primase/helicase
VSIDPPERIAKIILARAGVGKFPQVAGVITTATLRPDGSVLAETGYDAPTRLYLALDSQFAMPTKAATPTRANALVPSRVVLELGDASPGSIRLSDHAARSMI